MELGHGSEIAFVGIAFKHIFDAAFQLVRQRLDAGGEFIARVGMAFFMGRCVVRPRLGRYFQGDSLIPVKAEQDFGVFEPF